MKKWTSFAVACYCTLLPALLMASEGAEHGAEHAEAPHGPPMTVWFHPINFVILAVILVRQARRPIHDHIVRRSDTVREQLEKSEKARKEAEARASELDARLQALTGEIDAMKVQAAADVKEEAARLVANAEAMANRMKTDADKLLRDEVARARVQMRQEVIGLAIDLAARMLSEKVNQDDQRRLADEYLRQMTQSKEIH